MKQRGTIRAFFQPKPASRAPPAAPVPAAEAPQAVEQPAEAPEAASALQQFSRKRRRTDGDGAAAPAAAEPAAATVLAGAEAGTSGGAPAAGKQPRPLTQLFLDAGQRHFHCYRCPDCGMLYARGTDADERLHATYHAAAAQGPRYGGWPGERVVQLDGSRGRVLLFSYSGPGRGGGGGGGGGGGKHLRELSAFLEGQMGLPKGWLLQVPLTLLLYVSAAKRVQGCVAAESIREAFHVAPGPLPPAAARGMLSAGSAAVAGSGGGDVGAPAAACAATAAAAGGTPGRSLRSATLSSGAAAPAAECSSGGGGDGGEAAAGGRGPGSTPPEQQQQQGQQQQGEQQQQQQGQQQQGQAGAPLELDRRRAVRAVCGVRLAWVSLDARRRGLASRLLDCCRSHFMPGYVLPREELAFSAPTDDGRALIERYTGSRRFLVYE